MKENYDSIKITEIEVASAVRKCHLSRAVPLRVSSKSKICSHRKLFNKVLNDKNL